MIYLLMALAVFTIVRLMKAGPYTAPEWLWQIVVVGLSAGISAFHLWSDWWIFLAVAAVVEFLQLVENLLIVKTDEAMLRNTRRSR